MTAVESQAIYDAGSIRSPDLITIHTYSGRGMYGERTFAITGDERDVVEAMVLAGYNHRDFRWDNMGLKMVAY